VENNIYTQHSVLYECPNQ